MKSKAVIRVTLSSVAFAALLVALSFIINAVWLGEAHEKYDFLRPDSDFLVTPGLGITTLLWSALISVGYRYFGERIRIRNPFLKGMAYGFLVYAFFIFFHEFFLYQFIKFDFIIIFGSLLHYFLSFVIGGGLIGVINSERE